MKYLPLAVAAIFASGCTSTTRMETRLASLEAQLTELRAIEIERDSLPQATLVATQRLIALARRNECIARELEAKVSCDLLLRTEQDDSLFQAKLAHCVRSQGFPIGLGTCK